MAPQRSRSSVGPERMRNLSIDLGGCAVIQLGGRYGGRVLFFFLLVYQVSMVYRSFRDIHKLFVCVLVWFIFSCGGFQVVYVFLSYLT